MRSSAPLLGAALFTLIAGTALVPVSAAPLPIVNVVATADQKFVPDHIVLHAHRKQWLRFSSTGGVHGVASPDLGIPATTIAPGKPVSVSVLPAKAGTYTIPCSIVCGPNHASMALTVVVKK